MTLSLRMSISRLLSDMLATLLRSPQCGTTERLAMGPLHAQCCYATLLELQDLAKNPIEP